MALSNALPEVWADEIIDRWEGESVFPNLVSRRYEGIAARGNVVHLTGIVPPTVKNYKTGVLLDDGGNPIPRTTKADDVSDTGVDLLIDQEKVIDFKVQDIDAVQSGGIASVRDYTNAAGDAFATDADTFLGALLIAGGTGMTASAVTTGNAAWDKIVEANKWLTKAKVPAARRVIAVNAEYEELLLKADSKLTSWNTSGDTEGLRNATLGKILGFRVVTAINLPTAAGDMPRFVAFHQDAAAFVAQIDSLEGMRDNDSISDRVRGLHVYGGKVVKAAGVRVFTAS